MNATKMYERISEQLAKMDITHAQRMEIRRIIADIITEELDEDITKIIDSSVKIKHEHAFSIN